MHLLSSSSRHFFFITFLFLFCLSISVSSSSTSCSADEVSCAACSSSSSRANDIAGLPRLNARGDFISSNLGDYYWYDCDAFGNNCIWWFSAPQYSHWFNKMPDNSHPINYVQGLAFYVVFGLACLTVSLLVGFSLCCCRYWYDSDIGGLCGGRYPQRKLRFIGVIIDPKEKRWKYSLREQWAARFFTFVFVALCWTWIGLGYFNGSSQLPAALKDSTSSPQGLVSTLQSTEAPIASLLLALSNNSLINLIDNIKTAFDTANIDLSAMNGNMSAIAQPVQNLPNITALTILINNIAQDPTISNDINASQTATNIAYTQIINSLSIPLSATMNNVTLYDANDNTTNSIIVNRLVSNMSLLSTEFSSIQSQQTTVASALITFNTSAPTNATISNVTTGSYGSLIRLIPDTTNTNPMPVAAERDTLLTSLTSLRDTLASLPNYTIIANTMNNVNTLLRTIISSTLPNIFIAINTTQSQLSFMATNLNDMNISMMTLNHSLYNVNLSPIYTQISNLNDSLITLLNDDVSNLNQQFQSITNLSNVLPAINYLLPMINLTNNQLIQLPTSIMSILNTYNQVLNQSLPQAINKIQNITTSFGQAVNDTTAMNSINTVLTNTSSQLMNLSTLLNTTFINLLSILQTSLISQFNLSNHQAALLSFNNSISNNLYNQSFINTLAAYQTYYQSFSSLLNRMVTDLTTWNTGVNAGRKRCNVTTTTCIYDSSCTTLNDYCLVDYNRVSNLIASLINLPNYYMNDTDISNTLLSHTALNTSINTLAINNRSNSINNSQLTLSNIHTMNINLFQSLSVINIQLINIANNTALNNSFAALNNHLYSLYNVSDTVSTIQSLNSSLTAISDNILIFDDIAALINTLVTFLYETWPTIYKPAFSSEMLSTSYTGSNKLANLTLTLATLIDNMTSMLTNQSNYLSGLTVNAVNETSHIRDYMGLIYTDNYSQFGSIYYLISLYNKFGNAIHALPITTSNVVNYEDARINTDANGNTYDSNTYCVTDVCIENTVDYYLNNPISDISNNVAPIPITINHLNGLFYLIPAIIGLLSLIAMLLYKSYKYSSKIASCTAALMLIFLPLFLLFAIILFPLVIIEADTCHGGLNVVNNMILAKADMACTMIGGVGEAVNCDLMVFNNFDIIINIPALFEALFGENGQQCSNTDNDNAILAMFNSVRTSALTWPHQEVAGYLSAYDATTQTTTTTNNNTNSNNTTNNNAIYLQPAMMNVFLQAADNSVPYIDDFITSMAATLSCNALNSNWRTIKDSVCCPLTTSLYWFFGSWFLISLSILFIGVPAIIYGKKRYALIIPENELVVINRYFPNKDKVIRDEALIDKYNQAIDMNMNKIAANNRNRLGALRRRQNSGSVVPVSDEEQIAAIELACARAEAEKLKQAGEGARDEGQPQPQPNHWQPGEEDPGYEANNNRNLLLHAAADDDEKNAADEIGEESRVDMIIPSPSVRSPEESHYNGARPLSHGIVAADGNALIMQPSALHPHQHQRASVSQSPAVSAYNNNASLNPSALRQRASSSPRGMNEAAAVDGKKVAGIFKYGMADEDSSEGDADELHPDELVQRYPTITPAHEEEKKSITSSPVINNNMPRNLLSATLPSLFQQNNNIAQPQQSGTSVQLSPRQVMSTTSPILPISVSRPLPRRSIEGRPDDEVGEISGHEAADNSTSDESSEVSDLSEDAEEVKMPNFK